MSAVQRFWAKVDKTGECWLWTGCCRKGYGRFYLDGKWLSAHRFAYELLVGPIPEGALLDHRPTCPKRCVRPDHVRPTTTKQNSENQAGAHRDSKTGVRGVYMRYGKYIGTVCHNGKNIQVGTFVTLEEAAEAVAAKRRELFTHNDLDRVAAV